MITLIGLTGKAGSGKTTIANYLVKNCDYVRLRFAETLKSMLYAMGLTHEETDGDKKTSECELLGGNTPRYAMQTLGTEWGRDLIHPDIWVKCLERKIGFLIRLGQDKFVIDDCRFINEVRWIKKQNNSIVVRVVKDNDVSVSNHQSETEMGKIIEDWRIYNNDSFDSLYQSVDEMLRMYFTK